MKRKQVSSGGSKRLYTSTSKPHPKNTAPRPIRGGIRL